ncbi:CRISPR system precrRNA processing endoribonuclease RAMP protein Cas6 [Actinokineospora soli]|uniref:CRISPR system precrRNA processing endoribonuclease RAMP protein Cas6 n=1 Tax=Actinokineospora soli TaxID=1048753 RepID=A0ABW2TU92_9PSEU
MAPRLAHRRPSTHPAGHHHLRRHPLLSPAPHHPHPHLRPTRHQPTRPPRPPHHYHPLYFSRNGHDHPLPDPALLYRSAATRWNHHAPTPLTIPDHDLHDLRKHTYITHLDGQTTQAPVSATMNQTGFIGQLHLALTRHTTPTTRTLFATLTHYLTIAGAGAQTTHGFGSLHLDKLTP